MILRRRLLLLAGVCALIGYGVVHNMLLPRSAQIHRISLPQQLTKAAIWPSPAAPPKGDGDAFPDMVPVETSWTFDSSELSDLSGIELLRAAREVEFVPRWELGSTAHDNSELAPLLVDVSPLLRLPKLESLTLPSNWKVGGISQLAGVPQLRELTIRSRIWGGGVLPESAARWPALESLDIRTSRESEDTLNWCDLGIMPDLDFCWVEGYSLQGIECFRKSNKLTFIRLEDVELPGEFDWASLPALEVIYLRTRGAPPASLVGVGKLRFLESLFAQECSLESLDDLRGSPSLKWLVLEDNRVSNITAVEGILTLERLHLAHNQIENIGPLASLVNLEEVTIGGNPITGFDPLLSLPHLQTLWIDQAQATSVEGAPVVKALEERGVRIALSN